MLEVGPVYVAYIAYVPWSFRVENIVFAGSPSGAALPLWHLEGLPAFAPGLG
jgi:hypothetical protein